MHAVVVIGAGIAGLSAAWELASRKLHPLVVEQSPRAGGVIRTDCVEGFVIDAGPDSLLMQKPAAFQLCEELGIAGRLVPTLPPRTAYVLKRRRLVRLPEGSFLGIPTRIWPFVATRLFSWRGKLRMAAEPLVTVRKGRRDESIGSFIRRRFGSEAVTYLAEPLLAGIHAGDVERLSIHALFPRFTELERGRGSVLRGVFSRPSGPSPNGAFQSFPGGLGELVSALTDALGEMIRLETPVASVHGSGPFTVVLASGETIAAKTVIVTTPAPAASSLIRGIDQAAANLCDRIQYASSATVAFGLRRAQVRHPLEGSGFVVSRRANRELLAATWVSSKWPHRAPDGHVLIRGFLGGTTHPGVLTRTDEELAAIAFREMSSILGISGEPLLTRVYRWPSATPQYVVGHLDRIWRLDERLASLPGLYLTGSGYRGTGIPDCIADARATAAKAAEFVRQSA